MKCPKCGQELTEEVKFCTKCGVNIDEENKKIAEEERRKKEKEEKRKKALEDKKRLEEIRKEEERKKQEKLKEAEKAEAIRKAKEEGIELEIIDEKKDEPKETNNNKNEFKVKSQKQDSKKRKVRIKKNIFQILFGKLMFLIIVSALIIGGVYYSHKQKYLPDFAEDKVGEFENRVKNVVDLKKEVDNGKKDLPDISENKEDSEN